MNDCRDNAGRFATTPATRVREERQAAINDAMHCIREHRDWGTAALVMFASVMRQSRFLPERETEGPIWIEATG